MIIVLNYLEGMSREGDEVDDSPPASIAGGYKSKGPASQRNGGSNLYSPKSHNSDVLLHDLAKSPVDYGMRHGNDAADDDDDADSNEQNGLRSELGEALPVVRSPSCLRFLSLAKLIRSANLDQMIPQALAMSLMILVHLSVILAPCLRTDQLPTMRTSVPGRCVSLRCRNHSMLTLYSPNGRKQT